MTRGTSAKVADGAPRWSPGGGWIAFTRSDPRHEAVHVVRPDGSGERLVARNARGAAWSPAGDRLAVLEGVTAESRRLTLSVVGVRSRERRALVRLRVRLDGAALGPQSWRPPAGAR